ncbi:DUF3149 domain-containing protein [Paraglaciecola arctica]|jgi:hypothetical protein|uniref:DUF3149 domain-containing protein n=1 Tax=Paraglaciecola arctica BSs20135 TaxID=493475 RepID=K6Z0L7_9ALTE|nr:DUF3149 domain-containing protein [Paraglaciecola arctica]GAC17000.1 hypothetical protein GARC_0018 [Paraglaciecola arctica BSs20135]
MWDLILHDPVAWGSILGIGIMVAMAAYYVYLFIHNTKDDL